MKELTQQLLANFQHFEANLNGQSIHQTRQNALANFEKMGFPTIKHEEWKYSNLSVLAKQTFAFAKKTDFGQNNINDLDVPHLEGNILYFVNGHYKAEISQIVSPKNQLTISSFADADVDFLEKYFAKTTNDTAEALTALNTAFAHEGVVIHVPKNTTVEQPIILRFISDARLENVGTQPRNLFVIEQNAEVKIAESFRTIGEYASFTNIVTEIVVEKDARVQYYKIQNETEAAYHIGTTQVLQHDNSHFYAATVSLNGGFIRNNLNIRLDGQHCDAHMYGLYFPNGNQHIDNHTLVDHAQPNSESNELYKGILKDKATGVFNGKIFVREDAQKTNAYQSCRNVVLSENASMNTKPQLEIYADDVKCSHGTTTGQLDDEALFYMRSRGIPQNEAQTLLMFAFCEDVVEKIKIDSIRTYLERIITEKLGQ